MSDTYNSGLLKRLVNNLADYEQDVEITKGYDFNMGKTINKIELYRASKFESGEYDSRGNLKYFFNITNPQCGNATKNIDINRSDIRVRANEAKDRVKAMLYSDELKLWMKEKGFGILLNKISEDLPIYGSVVLKKVGDNVEYRPLRYLKFDPAVSNSPNNYNIQSSYMIDEHSMSTWDIEKMDAWDAEQKKELLEEMRKNGLSNIIVYEQYCEVPYKELGIDKDGYTMSISFLVNGKANSKKAISKQYVLFKKPITEMPYKKLDYLRIEGRALGLGISEMLFPLQMRRNEMGNQKAESMRLSSKTIFQTRDANMEGNMLTDVDNGDILNVNSELTQVPTEERNLSAYNMEENNIIKDTRDNANAQEILTGETLPSRTPFRLGALQMQQAAKLFEFIKQNYGMFIEEVLGEWVIPVFEKETNKEHIFEAYSFDTIRALMEESANYQINEAIKKSVLLTGNFPTQGEIDTLKQILTAKSESSKFVKVIKSFFSNFDKRLDIDITGEKNSVSKIESISNFIQLLAQNPVIMQNPDLMRLVETLANEAGISPSILPSGMGGGMMPPINNQIPAGGGAGFGAAPMAQ